MLSKSSTTTSTAATTTTETEATIYCRHRSVCSRCDRPTPSACVCQALPLSSLVLSEVKHVWILQHPHEQTRKNRSLPLVQLCFDDDDDDHDFITVTIARRFPTLSASMPPQQQQPHNPRDDEARLPAPAIDIGRGTSLRIKDSSLSTEDTIASSSTGHRTDTAVVVPADAEPLTADQRSTMNLQSPLWMLSTNVWLLFPGEGSISLTEAIAGRRENQKDPVVLLVLDGTWKYAKEMDRANRDNNCYPSHMIRVHLEIPGDFLSESKGNDMQDEVISTSITLLQHQHQQQQHFQPRRFDIRSPPSAEHLSTAEALAKSLSRIEDDDNFIYNTIMKPLDLMVRQWHGFAATTKTTREQEKRKNSAMTKATSNDSSQPRSKRSSSGSL